MLLVVIIMAMVQHACATTVWGGTYVANNACSTSQCCCVSGTFTLAQSGSIVTGSLALSGGQPCGGSTGPFTFSVTLSSPTATTFSAQWVSGQTLTVTKNGATVTLTNTPFSQCSGGATCTSGDCLTSGGGGSSSTCFHADTRISYKGGAPRSLSEFQHQDCHVPHVVKATSGVRIETACASQPLQLTGDHLVYSERGLVAASELVQGDILFADMAETHRCPVKSVTRVDSEELYFGLNCMESDVLANGLKASTFGHYHWLPSAWMKYASKVVGVERASRWGDALVALLAKMKVL